jgi:hypothetical protein
MSISKNVYICLMILFMPFTLFAQRQLGPNDYLVDSSYEFEPGKHHILQYRANVRTGPNRDSSVIAILRVHDEIEILENTWFEEIINDVQSYWYKIKYGNIIGYTFGGNIAVERMVIDIDNNGVNDYFYYRFSYARNARFGMHYFDTYNDIIIYINNQRIGTNDLKTESGHHQFEECYFTTEIDENGIRYVIICLRFLGRDDSGFVYYFIVESNGKIEPVYGDRNGLYPNNHFD